MRPFWLGLFAVGLGILPSGAGAIEPSAEEPRVQTEPGVEAVEAETREIQERVNQSKSAIDELTQRVLDGAEPSELAIGEPRVAPGLEVASVQYLLDGTLVESLDTTTLQPGSHELVARLKVEGDAYLSLYAFRMQAQTDLPPTSKARVSAAVVLELDEGQPTARFDVTVDE